jgi:hypothetical protein
MTSPYREAARRFVPPAPAPRCPCCGRGPDAAVVDACMARVNVQARDSEEPERFPVVEHDPDDPRTRVYEEALLFAEEAMQEATRAFTHLLLVSSEEERLQVMWALERATRMRAQAMQMLHRLAPIVPLRIRLASEVRRIDMDRPLDARDLEKLGLVDVGKEGV